MPVPQFPLLSLLIGSKISLSSWIAAHWSPRLCHNLRRPLTDLTSDPCWAASVLRSRHAAALLVKQYPTTHPQLRFRYQQPSPKHCHIPTISSSNNN